MISSSIMMGEKGGYFQHWDFVLGEDGVEHWRDVKVEEGNRVYFELAAARTKHRVVGFLTLDTNGQARPFVDGFTAFADPETRLPTVRWDESTGSDAGAHGGLPALIDGHGHVRDLGAPDAPFLVTRVDPATWQCLNVLLPGWTFAMDEK